MYFSPRSRLVSKKRHPLETAAKERGVWVGMLGSLRGRNFCLGGRRLFCPLVAALFGQNCLLQSSSSSSIYYLSLRCNKIHTIHKNNLQKQNKNNFFHDRRLEGTCYGHLVKQPPIMHLFAHKSFRLTSIGSYCYQRDMMRQF